MDGARTIPEGLTVFDLPENHRKRLRTTNVLERLNREIKRRTRVATLFPNEASLLRLVTAMDDTVVDGRVKYRGEIPQSVVIGGGRGRQ